MLQDLQGATVPQRLKSSENMCMKVQKQNSQKPWKQTFEGPCVSACVQTERSVTHIFRARGVCVQYVPLPASPPPHRCQSAIPCIVTYAAPLRPTPTPISERCHDTQRDLGDNGRAGVDRRWVDLKMWL